MKKNYYMNDTILAYEYDSNAFTYAKTQYRKHMSDNFPEYSRDRRDFENFLKTSGFRIDFLADLEEIRNCSATLEYVAIDYKIPVIMVKYYLYKTEI